jgi:hypothetical protein
MRDMPTPCEACDDSVDFQDMRECRQCGMFVCEGCWDSDNNSCKWCAEELEGIPHD